MEILRVYARKINLQDLTDLGNYEKINEVHLSWEHGPSVRNALPMLKRYTNLRRLMLERWRKPCFPPLEELCQFIMELKHLTSLHIIYRDNFHCGHFKSEVDEVKKFVLPLRPNFKFYITCCRMFDKFRIIAEENIWVRSLLHWIMTVSLLNYVIEENKFPWNRGCYLAETFEAFQWSRR